jgi:hypothetical protein
MSSTGAVASSQETSMPIQSKDENRDIGLGPEHDWSSHAADAFGLMAVAYEEPSWSAAFHKPIKYPRISVA